MPEPDAIARRVLDGLEDAELAVPGHFVADIAVTNGPIMRPDGSIEVTLEALTVAES